MHTDFHRRMGTFFILVGLVLLLLFIASIKGQETNILYLLASLGALLLAYLSLRRVARPEPTRFAAIRKARSGASQRRADRQAKKDQRQTPGYDRKKDDQQ